MSAGGTLLTNRSRGFLKRRKFIKLVMTFTDVKWKQAAKLVDKLLVACGETCPNRRRSLVPSSPRSLVGKCALERGSDEPPDTVR